MLGPRIAGRFWPTIIGALFLGFFFTLPPPAHGEQDRLELTAQERQYLGKLRATGALTIATRVSDHVYFPQDDGAIKGFYFNLVREFSEMIDVPLKIRVVKWKDYFSVNGEFPDRVRSDPAFFYTPDLIKETDMYVDAFTVYPWREKIFEMVRLFPVKTMAVTRKGEEISKLSDLIGKKIAVLPQSTYADTLREIEKKLGARFEYLDVNSFFEGLEAVSSGRADVTCMDSHDAWINRYENLNLSLPLSQIQYIGLIVKKDNDLLASILKKFINQAQESGIFDKHWKEAYNIPFDRYLRLVFSESGN